MASSATGSAGESSKFNDMGLDDILKNPGLAHIRECIFGYLDYGTLKNCRQVSKDWYWWSKPGWFAMLVERSSFIKYLRKFGDRMTANYPSRRVSTIIPGWSRWEYRVQRFVKNASLKDLVEVRRSLERLVVFNGQVTSNFVQEATEDEVLMQLFEL